MNMRELSGFMIKRRFPLLFTYDPVLEFKPAWMIPLCAMLRDIQAVAPRTRFYEIIEAETGLLDVLFMSPAHSEEDVWKCVMEATEQCALRSMTKS
jgi:hypothetical protein